MASSENAIRQGTNDFGKFSPPEVAVQNGKRLRKTEDERNHHKPEMDAREIRSPKLPGYIGKTILSLLVFIMGATTKADWLLVMVCYQRSQEADLPSASIDHTSFSAKHNDVSDDTGPPVSHDPDAPWTDMLAEMFKSTFHGFTEMAFPAFLMSYLCFFGIGGILHFYYYIHHRDRASEWKCQPNRWLPPDYELHEIVVGFFSLNIGSLISTCLACWIRNGGWCMIYYNPNDYGYIWLLMQIPVVFISQDYLTYWCHRILHWPFLYKHFHKLHHTYKQPTAFSVTALHPVELVMIQSIYIAPIFLIPIHYVPYSVVILYTYYHGIIDHSGITFKRFWWQPWQPDCIFHDNHHQYFHVNFGFNIEYWDTLHKTARRKDRIYREDIYYGGGKPLTEASAEEIATDMGERDSENPLAYQGNQLVFALTKDVIQAANKKDS